MARPTCRAFFAAREGIRAVLEVGIENIRAYSKVLTQEIVVQAQQRSLTVRSPEDPEQRNGMVCIDFPTAEAVCHKMKEEEILTDWRPDCGLRISPHFYNSGEDIEGFFGALDRLL